MIPIEKLRQMSDQELSDLYKKFWEAADHPSDYPRVDVLIGRMMCGRIDFVLQDRLDHAQ